MSNLTIFGESSNVPSFVRTAAAAPGNLADVSLGAGYPVVSIKGKVFTLKDGDEKTLITKPDTDEPASSLEVVILDVGPSPDLKLNSRIFYIKAYEEGSTERPDCYSEDGVAPGPDAQNPQATKCAICPHNAKGTSNTGKGKRCSSSKRLAIAKPDDLDHPFLLRVPGDSLMAFSEYIKWMKKSGIKDTAHVVTRIGFDYTVAHPALTFKGLGWALQDPTEAKASETVQYITGRLALPHVEAPAEEPPFEQAAPSFVTKDEPSKAPEVAKEQPAPAKATKAPKVKVDDLPEEPKVRTEVKVEEPVESEPAVSEVDSDLESALDDLDFDA